MLSRENHYLITGGAGFIGAHLTRELLASGRHVTVIDNLSTGNLDNIAPFMQHPAFRFAIDTIDNATVLDRLASEAGVIIHLAAAVGVQLIVQRPVYTIETNISGTENVLKAAMRYRAKVLVASTSEVYGKGVKLPFAEDDDVVLGATTRSRWAYAASKMVDEFLALAYHREYDLPTVVVRLFNTIGPGQTGRYGMVLPRFVGQALRHEELTVFGDGQQRRCFCDARDVVRAIIGLTETDQAVGQVFNIGGCDEISILELANRVIASTDSRSKTRFVAYEDAYAEGFEDMRRRVPDITRINKLLGWQPSISLDETIAAVVAHLGQRPESI